MNLFWEKGYHATSLKDLERALSMKPGSIYAAFASKENLYLESLEHYFLKGRARFETGLDETASPLDALVAHLRSLVPDASTSDQRRACMIVKTLLDATAEDTARAEVARAYLDEMREAFRRGFERAQAAGEISRDADPARLAHRYQANIAALRIEVHRGAPPAALSELAEDMVAELEALRV